MVSKLMFLEEEEMKKEEAWNVFCNAYKEYITSFRKSRILTNTSLILLRDFPVNLPEEFKQDYQYFLEAFGEILESMVEEIRIGDQYIEKYRMKGKTIIPENELMFYLAQHVFTKAKYADFKYEIDELLYVDFENILMNNELIIAFAYLDSFLSDSLRIIYQIKPEQLKTKNKSIDYEKLFSTETLDELKEKIIEEEVFQFGWKSLQQRFDVFEDIGIKINLTKKSADLIFELEQVRHIIIHNNNKVNNVFIQKTNRKDLTVGEKYQVTQYQLKEIINVMDFIFDSVLIKTAEKFFGKKGEEIEELLLQY